MVYISLNDLSINDANKTDEQIAQEGLSAMELWMRELGLTMNISELGVNNDMLEGIVDGTIIMDGGYKVLERNEILEILKLSL